MIKNNSTKIINKFIVGSALFSASAVCMLTGIAILPQTAYATSSSTSVSISNGSFTSTYTSNDLTVPNNWSKISSNTSSVVACVVSTDSETFEDNKTDYQLTQNPGKSASATSSDNNIFMINSPSQAVQYGYESNSFTLSTNGNYVIQVPVKTQGDAVASLYLVDESNNFSLKLENISSKTTYNTYAFYVSTDSFTSLSVKLQLWLGVKGSTSSQGAVFFDEISAQSYTESSFNSITSNPDSFTGTASNASSTLSTISPEFGVNNFSILSSTGSNPNATGNLQTTILTQNSGSLPNGVTLPTNGNLTNNDSAYLIKNGTSSSVGIRTNNVLSIKQYGLYLVSVYVKTNTTAGGLTVKMVEKDSEDETVFNAVGNSISDFTTSSTDSNLNGWEKISFAVKGSCFKNTNLQMEFWLGSESIPATGYAFIGKTVISELSSTNYSALSETSAKKLVNISSLTEDSTSFANHSFNAVVSDSTELSSLSSNLTFAKPANLTSLTDNTLTYGTYDSAENIQSGIISTNESVFNGFGYYFSNPGLTPKQSHSDIATQTNNILAISQKTTTAQGYQSETKSLSASSTYKISVYVKTATTSSLLSGIDNTNGGANFYLETSDGKILASFENIVSSSEWTELSCYFKTGLNSVTVQTELWLGNSEKKATGVAFFDDLMIQTCEDTAFSSATNSNFVRVLNFASDNFEMQSANKTNGLYSSLNWSSSNIDSENAIGGILVPSTISSLDPTWGAVENPQTPNSNIKNILAIHNLTDTVTTFSNDLTQTLSANSYYKVSVWAKTNLASQSETNVQLDSDDNAIPYGAFISINTVTDSFQAITSTEWKQYSFYVYSDTEISLTLNLSLGSNSAKTSGYAYFANVEVSSIDEAAYTLGTSAIESATEKTAIKVETAETDSSDEDTSDTSTKTNSFNENLWLIIPTLITALALIIAVIGTILRQVKFNRFVSLKKKTNSYDRKKTLAKHARRAEVDKIINAKVDELSKTLSEYETKLGEEQTAYDTAKERYTELKSVKRANFATRKERIIARNDLIKANTTLNNTLADVNLIKDDIAKIKSDQYILKEEYQIIMRDWSEQRKKEKEAKQKQKNAEKMKKLAEKNEANHK